MSGLLESTIPARHTMMYDLKWSPAEKAIARRAFNQALQREMETIISKVKKMAEAIDQPVQLWELERYLFKRRKEMDERYDYRYSVLPLVFADLIRRGWLREGELQGLGEDKLIYIRRCLAL